MSKYNVGDKVVVRQDLIVGKYYENESGNGNSVVHEMMDLAGEVVTIGRVSDGGQYGIEEMLMYNWVDTMFSGLAKEEEEEEEEEEEDAEYRLVSINSIDDLKVGDLVLIRSDMEEDERYGGVEVDDDMIAYLGQIATIVTIDSDDDIELDIDRKESYWTYKMFKGKVLDLLDEDSLFEDLYSGKDIEEEIGGGEEMRVTYKVGDKVRIAQLVAGESYDSHHSTTYCNIDMASFSGQVTTISHVNAYGNYVIEADDNSYSWSYAMFDGLVEDEIKAEDEVTIEVIPKVQEAHIVDATATFGIHVERIIFNEPATIMFYRIPNINQQTGAMTSMSDMKKVVAKCNPIDVFSREQGTKACLLLAMRKEIKRELRKM